MLFEFVQVWDVRCVFIPNDFIFHHHRLFLLAVPEATVSGIGGIYDVFTFFKDVVPDAKPFQVEIIAPAHTLLSTASGLPLNAHKTVREVSDTDIVIVPSLALNNGKWLSGRYPEVVEWLRRMYQRGATLCSACSGMLLLAETGLLNGQDSTIHWIYERTCRENFPRVRLQMDKVLVVSGKDQRLVMSGTSSAWHDPVLYIIARLTGPASAIAIAKFFLLQWQVSSAVSARRRESRLLCICKICASKRPSGNWNPVTSLLMRSVTTSVTKPRRFFAACLNAPPA